MRRKKLVKHGPPEITPQDQIDLWARTANKLTPDLIEKFVQLALEGMPAATICNYLGVPETQFHRWVRRGEEYRLNDGEPKDYKIYGAFVNQFRKATATFLHSVDARFLKGKDKNWYKGMVILERRDRKNWGRNDPLGGSDDAVQTDERFD